MSVMTEPSSYDVLAVVEEVWTTFLGGEPLLPVVPAPEADDPDDSATRWYAAVTVSGAWAGVIVVSVEHELAHAVTDAMLGTESGDQPVPTEDVVDALGELVNVIGGNIKSLMEGPSKLSLPLVAQAPIRSGGVVETCRLDLSWGERRLVVTVGTPEGESGVTL